jgi:hypothetical protein
LAPLKHQHVVTHGQPRLDEAGHENGVHDGGPERVPQLEFADGLIHRQPEQFGVILVRQQVRRHLGPRVVEHQIGDQGGGGLIDEVDRAGLVRPVALVPPVEPADHLSHERRPCPPEVGELGERVVNGLAE